MYIYFFMCSKFSEGYKAIINSFGLEDRLGFWLYPFEWFDSFKTSALLLFFPSEKQSDLLFFFKSENK